jgi:hypothetical protein
MVFVSDLKWLCRIYVVVYNIPWRFALYEWCTNGEGKVIAHASKRSLRFSRVWHNSNQKVSTERWPVERERLCITAAAVATMAAISRTLWFAALESVTVSASAMRFAAPSTANPLDAGWRRTKKEANAARWDASAVIVDLLHPPSSAHRHHSSCAALGKLQNNVYSLNRKGSDKFWRFVAIGSS